MSYGYWKPYVPVAKRRAQATKAIVQAKKAGQTMSPVVIDGRAIAKTFWGKAWCENLEAYSDFANRLPRGRTYARNGSILDLTIGPGQVRGLVMGSHLYEVEIDIKAVATAHWESLVQECTGDIHSLLELLQGKLSESVMKRLCRPQIGLFPTPQDIQLHCSCPDWASLCKHVAAVLYGVGARLDTQAELLFTLRHVNAGDLVTHAAERPIKTSPSPRGHKVLKDSQLAALFGIEIDRPNVRPNTEKSPEKRRTKPATPPIADSTAQTKLLKKGPRRLQHPKSVRAIKAAVRNRQPRRKPF